MASTASELTEYRGPLSRKLWPYLFTEVQPRLPVFDSQWKQTPYGMLLRRRPELEFDFPFKVSLTKQQNRQTYVLSMSYGVVTYPVFNNSADVGAWEGVRDAIPEMNGKLLTADPRPEISVENDQFLGTSSVYISMGWGRSFHDGEKEREVIDSNPNTGGDIHKVYHTWLNYTGLPVVEIITEDEKQPARVYWEIARLGTEPGEFTQRRRSDIYAVNYAYDFPNSNPPSSEGGDSEEPGEQGAEKFDQNPPTTEQAGPPWPVPVGPPPPTGPPPPPGT